MSLQSQLPLHDYLRQPSVSSLHRDELRSILETIYTNGYFTNHGPLAQEFESQLQQFLDIENVVTVGNESLALLIALTNCVSGKQILVPAFGGQIVADIAAWLQLDVMFCDVNESTGQPTLCDIAAQLSAGVLTIVLVETWGHRACPDLIRELTKRGLRVVIVAFDSFGAMIENRRVIEHPNVVTVYSFATGQLVDTLQGGAIATSDPELAERFRNTRSSYGMRKNVDVKVTCNGRFSEFQAGAGIVGLTKLDQSLQHHVELAAVYRLVLQDQAAIQWLPTQQNGIPNHQCFPIVVNPTIAAIPDASATRPGTDKQPVSLDLLGRTVCLPMSTTISVSSAAELAARFAAEYSVEPAS